MCMVTDSFCLFTILFNDRYIYGEGVAPRRGVSRKGVASNLLSSFLGLIFNKSTLQVIAVGYVFYSERTYLLEEEASMEVDRGGTK